MKIKNNVSLQAYNTFGIDVKASSFITISSEKDLTKTLADCKNRPIFILSGGSNMLLTQNIDALVLHIAIKGISIKEESENSVLATVMAGEIWHDFVCHAIDLGLGGLENLSLIPGYVGSAPIQNIGAYGVELKDTFVSCKTIDIKTQKEHYFSKEDCKFEYRNSIFKNELKGKHIITQVTFRLTKSNHNLRTNYGAITEELKKNNRTTPTIKDISDAVINIRKSKLPNPKEIGNSGSFFKNPIVTRKHFDQLREQYPDIPFYEIDDETIKIPAGWLIERSGFKGKRWGDAGVHSKQALVLVNYGSATGNEILKIATKIQQHIQKHFNIQLEMEVNII